MRKASLAARKLEGSHVPAQHFRVDRGPDHVEPSVIADVAAGGDHEVGNVAETRKHVADVDSPDANLVKPVLVLVVLPLQFVGAHVRALLPVGVDDAQVDQAAKGLVHVEKHATEFHAVTQIFIRLAIHHVAQRRPPLFQETIHDSLRVGGNAGNEVISFCDHGLLALGIAHPGHDSQRSQRYQRRQRDRVDPQPTVVRPELSTPAAAAAGNPHRLAERVHVHWFSGRPGGGSQGKTRRGRFNRPGRPFRPSS